MTTGFTLIVMSKKLFASIFLCFAFVFSMFADTEDEGTISVVVWLNKGDTLSYKMNSKSQNICGSDTTTLYNVDGRFHIDVTDSTSTGYRMIMVCDDVQIDTTVVPAKGDMPYGILQAYEEKLLAFPVEFETNEFGAITRLCDTLMVQEKVKSVCDEAIDAYLKTSSEAALIRTMIPDFAANLKNQVSAESLMEDYLKELNLLFAFHGYVYEIGVTKHQIEASDTQLAGETAFSASMDEEDELYWIYSRAVNIFPEE